MNLFRQQKVEHYFAELIEQIKKEVSTINIANINIEQKARQIADIYELEVPSIEKERITSVLNLEDSNGNIYQEHPNAMYGRPDVVATATFTIPINGDERGFGLLPSTFSQKTYPALVSERQIKFKVPTRYVRLELPNEWKQHIKTTSQEVVGFIETSLLNLSADFDKFNSELVPRITELLMQKKQDWERKQQLDEEINPFK